MTIAESCSIPEFYWYLDPLPDIERSISLPESECSIWVWCPCSPYEPWDYCSRSNSSCPMEDICTGDCAGDGGWYIRCGDPCLGPPCFSGRFYGEVSIICRCPSDINPGSEGDVEWSLTPDPALMYCPDDFPAGQPHPWAIPYGRYSAGEYVPHIIFPEEECGEGGRGVWTWCPCGDDAGSYPSTEDCEPECPDDGNCADNATGDGHWVYRGGCEELGPPPVLGRFYGETIMTGFCCEVAVSFSESSLSASLLESLSSCSMPQFPVFWWDLVLQENPPWNQVVDRPDDECSVSGDCSAWLWCQCTEDMSSSCEVEWGTSACPYDPEDVDANNGAWLPYGGSDHHGPPCIIGRFYGEVVWYCQCPQDSSSSGSSESEPSESESSGSSESESSLSSSSCGCKDGGYEVVCPGICNEAVAGIYNIAGYYGGMPYYEQCGGPWVLYWEDNGDDSGTWYFSKEGLGGVPSSGYGASGETMDLPTDTNLSIFGPISPSTGNPELDCCTDCDCDTCPSLKTVNISGLTGYCAQANGNWTVWKIVGPGYCYYYVDQFPGNCTEGYDHIWINIVCECNLWWLEVSAEVCDYPPGDVTYFNNWISDPEPGVCPPDITWNMHIITEDCDPGGQIPTVTTSA